MEEFYGVLLNKKSIYSYVNVFVPTSIIKGKYINDEEPYFLDSVSNAEYLMVEQAAKEFEDISICVGYVISEEALQQQYPNMPIKDAMLEYLDEIQSNVMITIYDEANDKVFACSINYLNILSPSLQLNNSNESIISFDKIADSLDDNIGDDIMNSILKKISSFNNITEVKKYVHQFIDADYSYLLEIDNISDMRENLKEIIAEKNNEIDENTKKKLNQIIPLNDLDKMKKRVADALKLQQDIEETINVSEMKKFFDERVIGQEEAKIDVISAIKDNQLIDSSSKKGILLVGPTGCGKTLLASVTKDYLNIPMIIIPASQITATGYVGTSLEEYIAKLINKANGDIKKAERGIVVFDEIDKLDKSKGNTISSSVLNSLLSFIGGTTLTIRMSSFSDVEFNTSNLNIFATGAYAYVAENLQKHKSMGFNNEIKNINEDVEYPKLKDSDLIEFGNMTPELMGRLKLAQLNGHTYESLRKVLLESKGSYLLEQVKLFKKIGIDLKYDEGYINAIINEAFKLKSGARSLVKIIDESIKKAKWEVFLREKENIYSAVILKENTIYDNNDFELVYKNKEKKGKVKVLK